MTAPDLRPLFNERTAAHVKPGLAMMPVPTQPQLVLDRDALDVLREGLGLYDMELRWIAHLDDSNVLRIWRSWTGFQIYQADVIVDEAQTHGTITALRMEHHTDRHQSSANNEPALFERVLVSSINTLRNFRAGHTPYGPEDGADPQPPPPWPDTPAP